MCVCGWGGIIPAVGFVSLSRRVQCLKQFQYHVKDLRLRMFDPPPSSPHLQTERGIERDEDSEGEREEDKEKERWREREKHR